MSKFLELLNNPCGELTPAPQKCLKRYWLTKWIKKVSGLKQALRSPGLLSQMVYRGHMGRISGDRATLGGGGAGC